MSIATRADLSPALEDVTPGPRGVALASAAAGLAGLTMVFAFVVGGGAPRPAIAGLPSAGPVVQWALPVARLASDLLSIATIGLVLAAGVLLPNAGGQLKATGLRALRLASVTAASWAVSTLALFWFTTADITASGLGRALDPEIVRSFLRALPQGRALLLEVVVAALVAAAARWTTGVRGSMALLVLALAGVTPPLLTGHSAAAGQHMLAVSSLVVHVLSASLWTGGLAALVWIRWRSPKRSTGVLTAAIPRFSVLALWCVVALGASGTVNAAIRLGSWSALTSTGYGALVLLKAAALFALAALGARHRAVSLPALAAEKSAAAFARLAACEVLLMSAAVGLAVAMSRTPTPQVDTGTDISRVRLITGHDAPPPPTPLRFLLEHHIDGFFLAGVLLAGALYVAGLRAMHRRGDAWPAGRTISWFAGLLVVLYCTCGGLAAYAPVLFSVHMIEHMVLAMIAPILLVLGAPVTLALRTLPAGRTPGETGPRQALLSVLHSRVVAVVTHPVVAAIVFVGSLYGLYFTPLLSAAMTHYSGHTLMAAHFLASGGLFFYVLVGVDPAPRRLPHLARLMLLFVTMTFHAFFSVAIMSTSSVLAGDYYRSLGNPYGVDPLSDQHSGGGLGWAFGELPMLLVLAALFVSWIGADERESRRSDRAADRAVAAGEDDELAIYNARLRALNDRAVGRAVGREPQSPR